MDFLLIEPKLLNILKQKKPVKRLALVDRSGIAFTL